MTIFFENESKTEFEFPIEETLEFLVKTVSDYVACPYEVEVSVVATDKEAIHKANRDFRQTDRPTDVLSFPMMEYNVPADFNGPAFLKSLTLSPETDELVLGDIMVCSPIVYEQAQEYGHSVYREFSFLVVHSMLHLFGYDHMEEDEREQMEKAQREIMKIANIERN